MVSQDIAVTVNDNQPTNRDIAKAMRAIIDTSTPLILSSSPSSSASSTRSRSIPTSSSHQSGQDHLCPHESSSFTTW